MKFNIYNLPAMLFEKLRRNIVSEWLPSSGDEMVDVPEISVNGWFYKHKAIKGRIYDNPLGNR